MSHSAKDYADDYFAAVTKLVGRREDGIQRAPGTPDDQLPPAFAIFFADWPNPGVLSAFTLGLGLGRHVADVDGHVEILVSMRTTSLSWGAAAAFLGEQCRSHTQLARGTTLDMKEPLANEESLMTGFIIARPTLWSEPPAFQIADRRVVLLEARPLYRSEIALARSGKKDLLLQALLEPNYDVRRRSVALTNQ